MEVWTQGCWTNRKNLRQGYLDHYAHVRAIVPRERLLEFQPDDGWTQLCEFLEKPIPQDEPYPHVNEGRKFVRLHARLFWCRVLHVFTPCILTIAFLQIFFFRS